MVKEDRFRQRRQVARRVRLYRSHATRVARAPTCTGMATRAVLAALGTSHVADRR